MANPDIAWRQQGGILRHAGLLFLMRLATSFASAGLYMIMARRLGVQSFGGLASLSAFVFLSQALMDGGTSSVVSRAAANRDHVRSLGVAWRYRAWTASLGMLVVILYWLVWAYSEPSTRDLKHPLVFTLCVVLALLAATQTLLSALLIGLGRTGEGSAIQLVEKVMAAGWFLWLSSMSPTILIGLLSLTLGCLASCAYGMWLVRRQFGRTYLLSVKIHRQDVRQAFHFMITTLGGQLQNFDVPLVGLLAGAGAAGLLAGPSRLTAPLGMVAATAATIVFVQARHSSGISGGSGRSGLTLIGGGILVITALGVSPLLIAPDATARFLLGDQFQSAGGVFRLFAVAVCVGSINQLLAAHLQARGHEAEVAKGVVLGGALGLVVVGLTARPFGAIGGGFGVLAAQAIILSSLLLFYRKTLNRKSGYGD